MLSIVSIVDLENAANMVNAFFENPANEMLQFIAVDGWVSFVDDPELFEDITFELSYLKGTCWPWVIFYR